MMKIKSNMVLTGLSALSFLGDSPFNPELIHVAMPRGTNVTDFKASYKITTMSKDVLDYKVVETDGIRHFTIERLFVELDRFDIEPTVRTEIIKSLEERILPDEVERIYKYLKNKIRGIDDKRIEQYIQKYSLDLKDVLQKNKLNISDITREYVISIFGDNNIPVLLKGGSAVELFIDQKRSTDDIDLVTGKKGIEQALRILTNPKAKIYIKPSEQNWNKIRDKRIAKLEFPLYSADKTINKLFAPTQSKKQKTLKITFNKSLTDSEIENIINVFKLTKRMLRIFKKKSAITFSKEMLLAEKYHGIIIKPQDTTRAKDLFDIYQLGINALDWSQFYKWLFKRFETNFKTLLNKIAAIEWIKNNKDVDLLKIKSEWEKTASMYAEDTKITYKKAIDVYKNISNKIIEDNT